ncbi:Acyltransferase [Spongiibacter sp. IMCC21906]|uniref:lysophospholipid acyltransferase family protein n=1 Tax=Spongiibacter sp. IMCC21906 TaxID=1620392 RepID=UPI00062DEF60|nr:lysophospholipid acyltransferase family protein [Spongiibacter sp. IMCC21906]AKH70180.1 Acyltransferase [Spongiibacter sp. IMCC21906]
MQKQTIFKTPVVSGFFRYFFKICTRLIGWKIVGEKPADDKCVLIAAPHTSNWDFPTMMVAAFVLGMDVHWMGKHTLFPKGPLGAIMRWFGGIAIDRREARNTVEQMVAQYKKREQLLVLITPEGTRTRVDNWKAGFYHIAVGAGVPIYLGFVDTKTKQAGIMQAFYPSGDYQQDLPAIMQFYKDKQGFNDDGRYQDLP